MKRALHLLAIVTSSTLVACVSFQLPASGNVLWYDTPANQWSREYLPIGNGALGAMVSGGIQRDDIKLNVDSLWSDGGPFHNKSYNGGNHPVSDGKMLGANMEQIRQTTLRNFSGLIDDISVLTYDAGAYGSYSGAGSLTVMRNSCASVTDYRRWLDLDIGVIRSSWNEGNITLSRENFCSNPGQVCVHQTATTSPTSLSTSYSLEPVPGLLPTPQITCLDKATLSMRGQAGEPGMTYEILARVFLDTDSKGGKIFCQSATATQNTTIFVTGATSVWVAWTGGTDYDINSGDAALGFSFRGADPHARNIDALASVSQTSYTTLRSAHLTDYTSGMGSFSLDLGQTPDLTKTTAELVEAYTTDIGNPYLEWITFNYGRYMLFSSARGQLPANLQGVWARDSGSPWSGDYHANINLQQAYWSAESTNLDVTKSLWDFMSKTWVPRGSQTASTLYNSRGWVIHDEINIFGASGMKSLPPYNTAQWANYPAAAAWMMMHVWDHFEYGSGGISWFKQQGYPLIKGVALFWLDNLFQDTHFSDGTLIVTPCNSPEQIPTTFGCAHWQQLIWELFNAVEKGHAYAGDDDQQFLQDIKTKKSMIDRGIHIGSWGQLQEWKVDMDSPTDTHRHLSHLVGLYPGYSIANYAPGANNLSLSKTTVLEAARTSLVHRGTGTGPDGDAGWEKVWRAACYAQLNDADNFYHELKYALKENFGSNLFSLYNPFDDDPIFQFDANGAYPGAVVNALIQAPDVPDYSTPLIITLLPALPNTWCTGHITGVRLRGGIAVNMVWRDGEILSADLKFDRARISRMVQVVVGGKTVDQFEGIPGMLRSIRM